MSREASEFVDGGRGHFQLVNSAPGMTNLVGVDLGGFYSLDGHDMTPATALQVSHVLRRWATREQMKTAPRAGA